MSMIITITKTQRELAKTTMKMVDNWPLEEMDKLGVDEIARRLMVNRSTLSRAFRAYYYPTLERCIIRKKCVTFYVLAFLDRIKSVKEGMKILGISSRGNFTKQFKGIFRRTPGEVVREEQRRYREIRAKYAEKWSFLWLFYPIYRQIMKGLTRNCTVDAPCAKLDNRQNRHYYLFVHYTEYIVRCSFAAAAQVTG